MAKIDNSTTNIILGVLLGPLIGGYYGYRYAKLKQELYTLDPSTERGWDGAFTNIIVGTLLGNIAAPLFGYHIAKVELRIEDIKAQRLAQATMRQTATHSQSPEPGKEIESSKWRDHATALAQQVETAR